MSSPLCDTLTVWKHGQPRRPAHCYPKPKMPFLNLSDHDFKPPAPQSETGGLYRLQLLPPREQGIFWPSTSVMLRLRTPGLVHHFCPPSFPNPPPKGWSKDSSDGSVWENWA